MFNFFLKESSSRTNSRQSSEDEPLISSLTPFLLACKQPRTARLVPSRGIKKAASRWKKVAAVNPHFLEIRENAQVEESKENLRWLAWYGWIIAVIPDPNTGREHCVEAFLDNQQQLAVHVRPFDLSGDGDASDSVVHHKPITLGEIEAKYHGRFVGHFRRMREAAWKYLEQWPNDPENHSNRKGYDNASTPVVDTALLARIKCDHMSASRSELDEEIWLGNPDNLDQGVDGHEPFRAIVEQNRDGIFSTVVIDTESLKPVYLSSKPCREVEGDQPGYVLWRLFRAERGSVSGIPAFLIDLDKIVECNRYGSCQCEGRTRTRDANLRL